MTNTVLGELSSIPGHKREEMLREWRKLHNGGLQNLYSSSNTITVIKTRRRR